MQIDSEKILIIGNSPNAKIDNNFDNFFVVSLGEGFYHLPIDKINCWLVREPTYKQRLRDCLGHTLLLNPQKPYNGALTVLDEDKLTLGGFAINYFKRYTNKQIFITGITTNLSHPHLERGSFWNPNIKRFNHHHNLIKETMMIQSLLYERKIFEF